MKRYIPAVVTVLVLIGILWLLSNKVDALLKQNRNQP